MAGRGEDRPAGVFAYLLNEVGRAFTDIRQRVVEEGWFGRVTTPPTRRDFDPLHRTMPEEDRSDRAAKFDAEWAPKDQVSDHETSREQGHDMDR